MMKVRYIYSACVVIETPDVKILCDPWFTPGAYYGSWHQYPSLPRDPVDIIGEVDLIWISHVHPDHYDPVFLRKYMERYPDAQIVISTTGQGMLAKKLDTDGFHWETTKEPRHVDGTSTVQVFKNNAYAWEIDAALVVKHGGQAVIHMNDCPLDPRQIAAINELNEGCRTFALLPYSGAGPYPQCYEFLTEEDKIEAAKTKKQQFLGLYDKYIKALNPTMAMPFAGQYWFGGPLAGLNAYRGVADAVEATWMAPERSVLLADGGEAVFDLDTMEASEVRTERYKGLFNILNGVKRWDYEKEITQLDGLELSIEKMMLAIEPIGDIKEDYWFMINPIDHTRTYAWSPGSRVASYEGHKDWSGLEPRTEITVDPRLLFGLLKGQYNWNTAEIGGHLQFKRVPDIHNRAAHHALQSLHVLGAEHP